MQQSNKAVVIAILIAGGLIAAAILYTQLKPAKTDKPDLFGELKTAVAAQMRDPESATFQALSVKIADFSYCGEVNAKNLMGGYVGYRRFYASKGVSGDWIVTTDKSIVDVMCK